MLASPPDTTHASRPRVLSRRAFLGAGAAVALGLGLDAGELERHWITLERRSFSIEHLPDAFVGMRFVQISDLHYAEFTEPYYLHRVVEFVNALGPELVLLTGDFVSMAPLRGRAGRVYAPMCAAVLDGLHCRERYGSVGNHDWMVGERIVVEAMEAVGIRMLVNRFVPLERGGARLWLAGLGSALGSNIDLPASIPPHALRDREPVVLMAHEPDAWDAIAPYGVDLVLSGHTHGGQVRLPLAPPFFLPPMGERYVEGRFQRGRSQLYVNRGIGAVGLPFRFRCPPEVTEITLRRA
jgi:uncharacterized protein